MKRYHQYWFIVPVCCISVLFLLIITVIGNRSVTVLAENSAITHRKTVIIDAGHGGVDGGATSYSGATESHINLQIALKLNDLMHLLGINTKMIRTTDSSIHIKGDSIAAKKVSDLKERVRIVNETDNAYLISIHQNYFTDSKYSGAQVFYGNLDESKYFAEKLQTKLAENLTANNNRKIKPSKGIYLLDHVNCSAILLECGFISNPTEDSLLQNNDYQNKLCCVIATTFSEHLFGTSNNTT